MPNHRLRAAHQYSQQNERATAFMKAAIALTPPLIGVIAGKTKYEQGQREITDREPRSQNLSNLFKSRAKTFGTKIIKAREITGDTVTQFYDDGISVRPYGLNVPPIFIDLSELTPKEVKKLNSIVFAEKNSRKFNKETKAMDMDLFPSAIEQFASITTLFYLPIIAWMIYREAAHRIRNILNIMRRLAGRDEIYEPPVNAPEKKIAQNPETDTVSYLGVESEPKGYEIVNGVIIVPARTEELTATGKRKRTTAGGQTDSQAKPKKMEITDTMVNEVFEALIAAKYRKGFEGLEPEVAEVFRNIDSELRNFLKSYLSYLSEPEGKRGVFGTNGDAHGFQRRWGKYQDLRVGDLGDWNLFSKTDRRYSRLLIAVNAPKNEIAILYSGTSHRDYVHTFEGLCSESIRSTVTIEISNGAIMARINNGSR
ncbi:MAG: hypothetical protein WCT31_01290 [Candidatus Micrarchaeia archaeon]|jgi:hypothetical protein